MFPCTPLPMKAQKGGTRKVRRRLLFTWFAPYDIADIGEIHNYRLHAARERDC